MENARKTAGALCIVVAMVLGAFGGLTYAQSGLATAPPGEGTRGEDRHLVSAADPAQAPMTPEDAKAATQRASEQTALSDAAPVAVTSPTGPVAERVEGTESRNMFRVGARHESKGGTITVTRAEPNPGPQYTGPGIDAGGPYGGPDTFEGMSITFQVTSRDPAIIFFRWDFNADGVWDFPEQAGAGTLGKWTTTTTVTRQFFDNYCGDVLVQGWDGVSTYVVVNTGDNLGEPTNPYWYVFPANSGHKFTPKSNLRVTELGDYQWFNQAGYDYSIKIWDVPTQTVLASCTPDDIPFQWNWCTLSPAVNVVTGREYIIAEHHNVDYYPYFMGILGPPDPQPAKVTIGDFFYEWTTPDAFPGTDGGPDVTMMIDFRWQETLILPDAANAKATLCIENVAPSVFDVRTSPNPGLEGTPTELLASFDDPGLDDTWEYRWLFADGTASPWLDVSKFTGGAKVLFLHTYAGDVGPLITSVRAKCGTFCVKIDSFDWGPTGLNRVPSLAELAPYHVLIVGVNYFVDDTTAMGNRLADYMDAGGNVILAQGAMDDVFGCQAGICGRFDDEMYSPVPRGDVFGPSGTMGRIYVPGHPLLDGVSTVTTNGLAGNLFSVNPGATRIVDWNDGRVLGAVRTNPVVSNGARSVALNFFPILGYTGGDYAQMLTNAIRWASRQPDPVAKPMPIQLDPYLKSFADDEPTTTPQDVIPVSVDVRDDDDGTVKIRSSAVLYAQTFESPAQCNGEYYLVSSFPPGWVSTPNPYGFTCNFDPQFGSRGPNIWYYYNDPNYGTGNGRSYLTTPSFDLTGFNVLRYQAYHNWAGDYPSGTSEGIIEGSINGGSTFPYELHAFHHNDPGRFTGTVTVDSFDLGGHSDVMIRYFYRSNDDWWWFFDNVVITGIVGEVIHGLGSASGTVTVANVPPTVAGGFGRAVRDEAQGLLFDGLRISDPALIQPTEWFAYAFDFDDGTPVDWVFKGSLAPPKLNVLIVHTICLGPIDATCASGPFGDYDALRNALLTMDDVASVDGWDFINYPFVPTAPSLSYMLQYDVIIVATNWAYFSYAPFNLARQQVGDRLADYVDSGRGGVFSMMCVYCLSGGNDLFSIRGRYMDDQYGPFRRANYVFPGANGIDILDPNHDAFVGVGSDVGSQFIHDGKDPVSIGGNNNAAGRDGVLLATWTDDGNTALGAKMLNNGMQTVHFGGWHAPSGADTPMLFRNLVGIAGGGLPSPKIPAFSHTWADNGIYAVDIMVIDDDMGYVWKVDRPVAAIPETSISHRTIEVAVDNVDPTIVRTEPDSTQAFIASQFCVRVTGQAGNTVTLQIYKNGVLMGATSVTREGGDPNPPTEKCALAKVDVLNPASYQAVFAYDAPEGGSNPTWLIISPWREPISPGHGTTTYKYDFSKPSRQAAVQALPTLRADLFDAGQGAPIDFAAEAVDPGTDDLAFFWSWGGDAGLPYGADPASVYTIHVHHNDGSPMTPGLLETSQFLGFTEPYFDRDANVGRSPQGTADMHIRDTALHAFAGGQRVYYVFILVLDDDNARGYPSSYLHDGGDIEYIVVDLR